MKIFGVFVVGEQEGAAWRDDMMHAVFKKVQLAACDVLENYHVGVYRFNWPISIIVMLMLVAVDRLLVRK